MMPKRNGKTFIEAISIVRRRAVARFLRETGMTRKRWESIEWMDWHKQPELLAFKLKPLGGAIRFPGHELEAIQFTFVNTRDAELFGFMMEVDFIRHFTGIAKDVNDAAREAITGLLELAYLRATQSIEEKTGPVAAGADRPGS